MVRRTERGKPFSSLDQEILTTRAEQAVGAIRNAQMYERQERVTWGTIRSLSAILDGMDSYSPAIVSGRKIMADVAMEIAREMNLPVAQQRSIQYAALLHDAGRVGIPEEILRKPSKLEPAEYDKVKEHTIKGARLLEPLEILEPAVPIILYHHERYDGTGYPKGLKKEAIPLGARILAVANAFEAMVCERPYRRAVPVQEAAKEIASHAGTQFDPKVVAAFLVVARGGRLEKFFAEK
jgi:HD-GYP domain-containing protein (c-di-GMP phosphodiesterase class II)